jgi:hypothetical protein
MQRAQPVLAAHYALAYMEKFERDRGRLTDCRQRVNISPLGAAALAGTSLPIDREMTARELGFDGVMANSIDAVSDRDFAIESVFVLTMIAAHLSGWAEEWVIWATQEFGYLTLPDSVCTGSSIMPQKKNPDVCELIRGKCGRVVGDLTALLVLVKGLPLAYNRDLQEDKRPLFDAFETVESCLELSAVVVSGASLNVDHIWKSLDQGFLDATTLMEWLIARGVPQRSAHEVVGKLVALCEERGCRLRDLDRSELSAAHSAFEEADVRVSLGAENSVRASRSRASTAPSEVDQELATWKARLEFAQDLHQSGMPSSASYPARSRFPLSFADLLDQIRRRPEMYLGSKSSEKLGLLIRGYCIALEGKAIKEPWAEQFPERFSDFVASKLGGSAASGWERILREHCGSDEGALDKFYELYDEWRSVQEDGSGPSMKWKESGFSRATL